MRNKLQLLDFLVYLTQNSRSILFVFYICLFKCTFLWFIENAPKSPALVDGFQVSPRRPCGASADREQLGAAWPFHATELSECSTAPAATVSQSVCPRSARCVHMIINCSLSTLRLWLALMRRLLAALVEMHRPEHARITGERGGLRKQLGSIRTAPGG